MKEYLKKYPEQKSDVLAALNLWGKFELENVLLIALKDNKKVEFIVDFDFLDKLDYKYV